MPEFHFDGEKYRASSAPMRSWGRSALSDLAFSGDERVVDLGCGSGELASEMADRVPQGKVLGLDANESMIRAAREKHQKPNLSFAVSDIRELALLNEVDLFFSNATLHWIKEHDRLLAALYRGLAPGGRARLSFAGRGNCPHFFAIVKDISAAAPFAPAFAGFVWPWYTPGPEEYREKVSRLPFSSARVWEETISQDFPEEKALLGWLDQPALVPFQTHLAKRAPELSAGFRKQAAERMTQVSRQADGSFRETFIRIHALLVK
ncbi:MAG: methyltransferase domain-containing protein [Thermodesulfobacteriota bacterium]